MALRLDDVRRNLSPPEREYARVRNDLFDAMQVITGSQRPYAIAVYLYLLTRYYPVKGYAAVSYSEMQTNTGMSRQKVFEVLILLNEARLIETLPAQKGAKNREKSRYRMLHYEVSLVSSGDYSHPVTSLQSGLVTGQGERPLVSTGDYSDAPTSLPRRLELVSSGEQPAVTSLQGRPKQYSVESTSVPTAKADTSTYPTDKCSVTEKTEDDPKPKRARKPIDPTHPTQVLLRAVEEISGGISHWAKEGQAAKRLLALAVDPPPTIDEVARCFRKWHEKRDKERFPATLTAFESYFPSYLQFLRKRNADKAEDPLAEIRARNAAFVAELEGKS